MNSPELIESLKAFGTGAFCGILFTLLKLPIPAPPVLAGIVGIVGVFAGFVLVKAFVR